MSWLLQSSSWEPGELNETTGTAQGSRGHPADNPWSHRVTLVAPWSAAGWPRRWSQPAPASAATTRNPPSTPASPRTQPGSTTSWPRRPGRGTPAEPPPGTRPHTPERRIAEHGAPAAPRAGGSSKGPGKGVPGHSPARKAQCLAGEGGGHSPRRWREPQALLNVPVTLTATCCNKAMTIPAELLGPCGGLQGSPPPRGHKTRSGRRCGDSVAGVPPQAQLGGPSPSLAVCRDPRRAPVSAALPLRGHTDPADPPAHRPTSIGRSGPPRPADVTPAPSFAVSAKSERPETRWPANETKGRCDFHLTRIPGPLFFKHAAGPGLV